MGTRHRLAGPLALVPALMLPLCVVASASADERGDTQALLATLKKDTAHRTVIAQAIDQADLASERATRLRAVGDEARARLADDLAREWAVTAQELVRAVDAEARAFELRRKASDETARLGRDRALIEEGVVHVGRLHAQIDEAARSGPKQAVEVHDADKRPPKPAASKPSPPAPAESAP